MTLEWWFAYLLTSIILSLSPGSGAINTMTTSLNHGYRGAVASIAGLQTGLAIMRHQNNQSVFFLCVDIFH